MSNPAGENDFAQELEVEIEAELTIAESSHPEDALDTPSTEWQFDPTDVQRYEVGLRELLGAVETLEDGTRPSTSPTTESGHS